MSDEFGIECEFTTRCGLSKRCERLWASYDMPGQGVWFEEGSPDERFGTWTQTVREAFPSGVIPIHWYVQSSGITKIETMPGALDVCDELEEHEDFLTHYTWPTRTDTGERLLWFQLPARNYCGGDFIQQRIGWEPYPLQPFLLLDHLVGFRDTRGIRGAREVWEFLRGLNRREES